MEIAVRAANVLDQRARLQETESALLPFIRDEWMPEQRARFVTAARALSGATGQSLASRFSCRAARGVNLSRGR
jgi:hypothetical protein